MRVAILVVFLVLILVTYAQPWVINPGASLSPGGYDLAEWASIHPISGGESPPLLTALLLRLPLVCAVLSFAFLLPSDKKHRILAGIAVLLIATALLPPFEFLSDSGNWNYRQQFALAVITLMGGFVGLSGWLKNYRSVIGIASAVIGVVVCLVGLSRAYALKEGFDLPLHIGVGGLGTAAFFGLLIAQQWQIGRQMFLRRPTRIAKAR